MNSILSAAYRRGALIGNKHAERNACMTAVAAVERDDRTSPIATVVKKADRNVPDAPSVARGEICP